MVADAPARAEMDLRADGWPVRDQGHAAHARGGTVSAGVQVRVALAPHSRRSRSDRAAGIRLEPRAAELDAARSWTQLDCWSNFICLSWLEA